MKKRVILACLTPVFVAAVLGLGNLIAPFRPLSLNDILLSWLISPGHFFVPDLAAEEPQDSQELVTNPELNRLYGRPRHFALKKMAGTFRIFCIGGSTTLGWPFQDILSYPDFLNLELKDVLPTRRVEVINAGFGNMDSSSDIPLIKELLRYDPNLILIYEGRNELQNFALHSGWRAELLIPHLWLLRHVSLYRWLRYRLWLDTKFTLAASIRRWADQGLDPDSKNQAQRRMLKNLSAMIKLARQVHCPIMFITQVRDHNDPSENWLKNYNRSIRRLAVAQNIPIIDAAHAFDAYHGGGLGPIFLHRLWHPDVGGYFLISQTVLHALARAVELAPAKDWRWSRERSELAYIQELSVSPEALATDYTAISKFCVTIEKSFPFWKQDYQRMALQYTALAGRLRSEGWAAMSPRLRFRNDVPQ